MEEERRPLKIDRRLGYGVHDAFGMILGSGQNFRDGDTTVIVLSYQVGESAADVDANELHSNLVTRYWLTR